jgi:hypothetical protein
MLNRCEPSSHRQNKWPLAFTKYNGYPSRRPTATASTGIEAHVPPLVESIIP